MSDEIEVQAKQRVCIECGHSTLNPSVAINHGQRAGHSGATNKEELVRLSEVRELWNDAKQHMEDMKCGEFGCEECAGIDMAIGALEARDKYIPEPEYRDKSEDEE